MVNLPEFYFHFLQSNGLTILEIQYGIFSIL